MVSASCQRACTFGGTELCSTNAGCPAGRTCQMTPLGVNLCM